MQLSLSSNEHHGPDTVLHILECGTSRQVLPLRPKLHAAVHTHVGHEALAGVARCIANGVLVQSEVIADGNAANWHCLGCYPEHAMETLSVHDPS